MVDYDSFAPYYDLLMGDRLPSTEIVRDRIGAYLPEAASVLELGCGTGSVLKILSQYYQVAGVERSPEMLKAARKKVPTADLHEDSITDFHLRNQFDVVICVFDTINHVLTMSGWEQLFTCAGAHVRPGGLFIFDMNTLGRLQELSQEPAVLLPIEHGHVSMEVTRRRGGRFNWDVRVYQGKREVASENVLETSFPIQNVLNKVGYFFEILEVFDPTGNPPTDDSARVYIVCKKKG